MLPWIACSDEYASRCGKILPQDIGHRWTRGEGTSEERLGQGGPPHLQQGSCLSEVPVPPVRGNLYANEALGAVGKCLLSCCRFNTQEKPSFSAPRFYLVKKYLHVNQDYCIISDSSRNLPWSLGALSVLSAKIIPHEEGSSQCSLQTHNKWLLHQRANEGK